MKVEQHPGYLMIGLDEKELDFLRTQDKPAIVGMKGSIIVYKEEKDGKNPGQK